MTDSRSTSVAKTSIQPSQEPTPSSATASNPFQDDTDVEQQIMEDLPFPEGTPLVAFHLKNGGSCRKHTLVYPDEEMVTPAYFSDCSQFRKFPDIVVHRGSDEAGEVVGGAVFRFSRNCKLLRGPGSTEKVNFDEDSLVRDELVELLSERRGTYSMTVPSSRGDQDIRWEKTKKKEHGVRGTGKWWCCSKMMYNYLITDSADGDVLGVYLQHPSLTMFKRGRLLLKDDLEESTKDYLLLAAISLAEKARRNAQAAQGAGVAGGQAGWMAGSVY